MDWYGDLRVALRALRRQPVFALAAVITLSVGIGTSTATFAVAHRLLLDPPPYRSPDELVLVWGSTRDAGAERLRIAGEDAARIVLEVPGVASAAFVLPSVDVLVQSASQTSHARFGRITTPLFDVLGVAPVVGSSPAAAEDGSPAGPTGYASLTLSHSFWQNILGGRQDVIGSSVVVDGVPVLVAGVMSAAFELRLPAGTGFSDAVDGWLSIGPDPAILTRPTGLRDQDTDNTGVLIARMIPGTSDATVNEALRASAQRIRSEVSGLEEAGYSFDARPMHDDIVRDARPAILAIALAVVFVLLVSCINVANLLLARLNSRSAELAVRVALGASRARLALQVMAESLLVAVAGGAMGLAVAHVLTRGVSRFDTMGVIGSTSGGPGRVHILVALGLTSFAVIVCGLVPALRVTKAGTASVSRSSTRIAHGSFLRARQVLVGMEIAFSIVLLTAAGLLLRSFVSLQSVDSGFDRQNLVTFGVTLPPGTIGGPAARAVFMRTIGDAIREVPGVRAVGLSGALPLTGTVWSQPWGLPGETPEQWQQNTADFRVISADYFTALGTRLLAGRAFTPHEDLNEDRRIVIVDAILARMLSPDGNAVGAAIAIPLDGRPVNAEIVGVVESVRHASLRNTGQPTLYLPYRQEASRTVGFAVRVERDAASMVDPIRTATDRAIAGSPAVIHDQRLMEEWVDRSTARDRFVATLASGFAISALLLAAVGLYGVIAYLVARRIRELGIRAALGASTLLLATEVLRDGARLVGFGVAAGMILAIAFGYAIRSLLFAVPFFDPLTLGLVALTLAIVSLLACWVPARRAARIQPAVALRAD